MEEKSLGGHGVSGTIHNVEGECGRRDGNLWTGDGQIYDDAGYADYIYEGTPRPKLTDEDAEWAREVLAQSKS